MPITPIPPVRAVESPTSDFEQPAPAPPRRLRSAVQALVGSALVLLAIEVAGWMLYAPRLGAAAAEGMARRELALVLDAGETVEQSARVSRRLWWNYYHPIRGVLAATDRRLIWVGVVPKGVLERDPDEPTAFDVKTWAYDHDADSVSARPVRVFPGATRGIAIAAPANRAAFAVAGREWPRVAQVTGVVERRQAALREQAERERQAQEYAAWLARQPVYHVVRRGEALLTVAARYGLTPDSLRTLNDLPSDRIVAGRRLLVKPAQ